MTTPRDPITHPEPGDVWSGTVSGDRPDGSRFTLPARVEVTGSGDEWVRFRNPDGFPMRWPLATWWAVVANLRLECREGGDDG